MRVNDSLGGPLTRAALWLCCGALLVVAQFVTGCDALNPAFVAVWVDPEAAAQFQSISNAPGHVVVQIANNADIDESLINYMQTLGVTLTPAERRALKPRVRMRLRITFVDGTFQTIEFITGTPDFVDPAFAAFAEPDLNQNTLDNAVVLCDVQSVQLEPGTNVEVYIPVQMTAFELVETSSVGGQVTTEFQPRETINPAFRILQVDDLDQDGNVILERNIGVRNVPTPITNVTCGTVIGVTVTGTLAVPFLRRVSSEPSYDRDDESTVAQIGGRYEFRLSAQ